jgi:autotransporter-associated beta strand protein
MTAAACAADGTWIGAADGAWNAAANWQGGIVASGAGSVASLASQPGPVNISNDVSGLTLKGVVAQGGAYRLYGLPLTLEGDTSGTYGLVVNAGSHVIDSAVSVNANSQINVADGATLTTAGPLAYQGNRTLTKRGGGEWVFAGGLAMTNASAYLDVVGGTLRLAPGAVLTKRGGDRQCLRVGSTTPGRVVVERGAALNVAAFMLGEGAPGTTGGHGTVFVDGGTVTSDSLSDQGTLVGRYAVSSLCVSNSAAVDFTRWLSLGAWARGELHIGGGSTVSAGQLALGVILYEDNSLNGGSYVKVGEGGTLSVTNLFVWRSSGSGPRTNLMVIGDGTAGSATLRLPATTRSANNTSFARLTVDGGVLELIGLRDTAYGESLTNYFYGLHQFRVGRAGAVIDTADQAMTVTQPLERDPSVAKDGGVTKRGAGTLTLAGGGTWLGPTVVEQGTLRLGGALPTNVTVVAPGAGLSLADGQFRPFAPARLTVGQGGASAVELEAGAGGACDALVLPAGAQAGEVRFTLAGLNGASSWWLPGEYAVATYADAAPDVGGWSAAAPAGVTAAFEVQPAQKRVVLRVAAAAGASVWLAPGGGAWSDAANWSAAPANDPGTAVLFGTAPGAAANVGIGSAVTVGGMTFDAPHPYTLSGAGITFGAAGVSGALNVAQGAHAVASALTLPADLAVTVRPGASLLLRGGAAGAGRLTVAGGGTLALTNVAAFNAPLAVDGATLSAQESAALGAALTVGAGGATVVPAYGKTLTLSGGLDGAGALTKSGASVLVLDGADSGSGARVVRNGTLALSSLTGGGDLVIGEGRLKYAGPPVTTDKGLTIRTSDATQGATFETDADVTFNGNVTTEKGVFVKAGTGMVTFAAPGVNTLGLGAGSINASAVMDFGPYGESPTKGMRVFQVVNGKVVFGFPGQTNMMNETVIVGGQSTTAANAETAGHLEVNDGYLSISAALTIGRGNGSAVTAPGGLESSVRINGGRVSIDGLWLGARLNDMATITARPLFEMNGGELSMTYLYGGTDGNARPRFVFNGGAARVTGTAAEAFRLAYGAGVEGELTVAGGTLAVSNTTIRLAENSATAKGRLYLNGGRLITRGINRQGAGVGEIFFNGGVLQPCQSLTLTNLSAAAVRAGGFVADVPAGVTLTVMQPLVHDDGALGATPDGGAVKTGAGTLVLGGANTYTGPTAVSGGVLRVTGTLATSGVTLEGGAVLSLTDGVCAAFAPPVAANGSVSVELDIAADGSAHDTAALAGGFGGTVRVRLTSLGTGLPFVKPGRYALFTFSGAVPDTTGWTVEGAPAVFEATGSTVDAVIGATGGSDFAEWTNPAGGAWDDAENWSAAPGANVLFGSAVTAPAAIDTGSGAAFGYMAVDSANGYTWSGGALTAGDAAVARGTHTVAAELNLPGASAVSIAPGAALNVYGAVSGAGALTVAGGGTLALTNGPAVAVPVTLDGATLATMHSTVFDAPFTVGAAGAVVTSAYGTAVTLTAPVTGPGGLTKRGSSVLTLAGGADFGGELWVRGGTVEAAAEPAGPLVIGEGTFRYIGPDAAFARGYTLRTTANTQAATFETDADITVNGPVAAASGAFIKLGSGTLTYAYAGENQLSAGDNQGGGASGLANRPPYGDSPAQGYRSYNVFNGKVVLGAPGQTNRFAQAVVVGGASTTQAGAETAGHMEVDGGTVLCEDYITVGRGNGSAVTAPGGLESTFTLNGGEVVIAPGKGVWLAAMLNDMATLTARPRFVINGGIFSTSLFYCGNVGGTPRPRIEVNGGALVVGPNDAMRLARCAGCETVLDLNGGALVLTNQSLNLAENYAGAKGTLNLNGGRFSARTIYKDGVGEGVVNFNGGVFEPTQNGSTLLAGIALNALAGGAAFDVPADVTYTVTAPLAGEGGLAKTGDGVLVLSATNNTYAGATTVSGGVLRVTGGGTLPSSVTVAAGGTLSFQVPAAGQTVGGITLAAGGALYLNASAAAYATGAVHVAGDLALDAGSMGVWPETLTNGTYTLLACAGTISGDPAELSLANGRFGKTYAFSVAGNELRVTIGTVTSGAAVWTSAAGGEWADAGNWAEAPGAGAAGLTVGFTEAITAPAAVDVAGAVTAGELVFDNANAYTLEGTGSLTLGGAGGAPAPLTVRQGTHAVMLPVGIGGGLNASLANGELHIAGAVSGEGKLVKSGAGRLKLAGANTYSGGTEIAGDGVVDVTGASPLGTGPVFIGAGGGVAAKDAPAVIANDVAAGGGTTWVGAYSPLTLSGGWTLGGNSLLSKVSTDELTVAGVMMPAANGTNRMEIRNGSVRFAAGADALFRSGNTRESITFEALEGTPPLRALTVEAGARVEAQMLYMMNGRTNELVVTGGELRLTGNGPNNDALVFGAGHGTVQRLAVSGGTLRAGDGTWSVLGSNSGARGIDIGGGAVSLAKASLGVRDEASSTSGPQAQPVTLRLAGGLLEAREGWNWMADRNGARLNEVWLDGGRLRLPATYATVTDRLNVSRLVFNGGTLETSGGGITAEDPADYLKGLKAAYVGAGGAVIDTRGRTVTLAQRLAGAGDVMKRGPGTLTLAKPPCVTGRVDVQTGTLRQLPEAGLPYPDDPIVRLAFDGAELRTDASAYTNAIGLVGSADTLTAVDGIRGNAARLAHLNALYVPYRDDHQNADRWTVSVWVRQSVRGSNNQRMTFFGTLDDYTKDAHDFLMRILADGTFRWLGTGPNNADYGHLRADVANAVPLNTWTMLTFVADGLNGFSMYVNGERRTMSVTANNGGSFVNTDVYGAGLQWLLLGKTGGKAFTFGAVADTDTDCFEGDIDEATVYRRALSAEEIALLYRGRNPYPRRVRVAAGATYDLAGAAQELAELTGEGAVGNGTAKVTGAIDPGDAADAPAGAWLTVADGLALGTNVTYRCGWTPAANDLVDVWGKLTVDGAGTIDLGLAEPEQMPGAPRLKRFPVMFYGEIEGAANLAQWRVTGTGRNVAATVSAADGAVTVTLNVPPAGTLLGLK